MLVREYFLESWVVYDNFTEYSNSHLLLKTWRNHVDEALQLILLRFGTDGEDKETSDIFLKERRQVHVLHGCVSNIDLLLKRCLFSTTHLGLNSHITE